jgi:hypothetical protein
MPMDECVQLMQQKRGSRLALGFLTRSSAVGQR